MPQVPKLTWAKGRLDDFREWFRVELAQTINDRSPLEKKWADQITQWRAALPSGDVDFPWPGAANFEFPLTAIHSDPVYADMMQTLHTPEDYWACTPKRPDRNAHANAFREFLTAIERNYLRMRQVNGRAVLDQVVHGTAIYKNHWNHDRRTRLFADKENKIQKVNYIYSAPKIEHVPLQYFYLPAKSWDIDADAPNGAAQWVAQKFYLSPTQLKQRATSDGSFLPDYDPKAVGLVERFLQERHDKLDETIRVQEKNRPATDQVIELFEVHVRFDADGDGAEEDLLVVFHAQSAVVLRAVLSPFLHGKRPFHKTVYLPTFGFYGMGMAELDEWSQLLMSQLLNHTVNNVVLTNTAMYAAPFGSTLKPGEPVYPGRVVNYQPGENPPNRIQLGDINQSLPQLQNWVMQVSEMRTAVSELRQGNMNNLPSRTPATTAMTIMGEGQKRFDMIMNDVRYVHGDMGLRLSQNIAQFYRDEPVRWSQFCEDAIGKEQAQLVAEILEAGTSELEAALGISVTATSARTNKDAEKQQFIGLMEIAQSFYGGLIQTALFMQQVPPDSPAYESAAASYTGGVQLLTELLSRFDIQNPSQYLGNMTAIAGALNAKKEGVNPALSGLMGIGSYAGQPALGGIPGQTLDPGALAALLGVAA